MKQMTHEAYSQVLTSANEKAGQSGRKRVKKWEVVFFSPPGGATGTVVHRLNAIRTNRPGLRTVIHVKRANMFDPMG